MSSSSPNPAPSSGTPAQSPTEPMRVFLLDDHEVVRRGVAQLVDGEQDLQVVGEASSGTEAMLKIREVAPHVAVLDVRLGEESGIEVCRDIRSAFPEVACIMLTSFSDDQALVDAAMAGAAGFVLKQIRGNDLIESIRRVGAGELLLEAAVVKSAIRRLATSDEGKAAALSDQERRIFELIGEGLSNRQIAEEMFLAEKTVKNYVSNLLAKLGMSRRTEAAAFAARIDERRRRRES